jgi:hypothetical protein
MAWYFTGKIPTKYQKQQELNVFPLTSALSIFMSGVKDTFPLVVAAIPFGLVFGAMGQAQGLADWVTLGISIFVFAGAFTIYCYHYARSRSSFTSDSLNGIYS